MSETEQTIFFAWQSDSPAATNRNAICIALTDAVAAIEAGRPGFFLKIDEATRDMLGAGDVPRSIREKIEAADMFLGDVTNVTPPSSKTHPCPKCPNPNVTFEIGYAAAHLGWNRMLLLINLEISKFGDLPFDFDHQRVSQYRVKAKADTKGIKKLTELLIEAISMILDGNPPRPAELRVTDPAEIRRKRDVEAVRWAFSQISLPKIEDHIERLPGIVDHYDFFYYESYRGVICSPLFHVNDPALDTAFRGLNAAWGAALSFGESYTYDSGDRYIFSSPNLASSPNRQRANWDSIRAASADMHRHLHALLTIVREHYVEIDIFETNRKALEQFRTIEAYRGDHDKKGDD